MLARGTLVGVEDRGAEDDRADVDPPGAASRTARVRAATQGRRVETELDPDVHRSYEPLPEVACRRLHAARACRLISRQLGLAGWTLPTASRPHARSCLARRLRFDDPPQSESLRRCGRTGALVASTDSVPCLMEVIAVVSAHAEPVRPPALSASGRESLHLVRQHDERVGFGGCDVVDDDPEVTHQSRNGLAEEYGVPLAQRLHLEADVPGSIAAV